MRLGIDALHLTSAPHSGVHIATRGIITSLAARACSDDSFVIYVPRKAMIELPKLPFIKYISPFFPIRFRPFRTLWQQFFLPKRLVRDNIEVLNSPCYMTPFNSPIPSVVHVHDILALTHPKFCKLLNRVHYKLLLPIVFRTAASIVVPTAFVKDSILDWAYHNIKESVSSSSLSSRIQVIPWGVDTRFRVFSAKDKREARERLNLPESYVLLVSRLEPKKNFSLAIRAFFAAVHSRNLPHKLLIAGPCGFGVDHILRQEVHSLNLSDRVEWRGFVSDVDLPYYYACADLFLFPSFAEGFGIPVLESMRSGTPVIGSDIGTLREVCGDAACLVSVNHLSGWRECIENFLLDENVRTEYISRGICRSMEYSWDVFGVRLWETISSVKRRLMI